MARDEKYGVVLDEYGKLDHDEPLFVIRGKDKAAPAAIREYAEAARSVGASQEFIDSCFARADEIEEWQSTELERVKVPD